MHVLHQLLGDVSAAGGQGNDVGGQDGAPGTVYTELRELASTQPWTVAHVLSRELQVNGYAGFDGQYFTGVATDESLAVDVLRLSKGAKAQARSPYTLYVSPLPPQLQRTPVTSLPHLPCFCSLATAGHAPLRLMWLPP